MKKSFKRLVNTCLVVACTTTLVGCMGGSGGGSGSSDAPSNNSGGGNSDAPSNNSGGGNTVTPEPCGLKGSTALLNLTFDNSCFEGLTSNTVREMRVANWKGEERAFIATSYGLIIRSSDGSIETISHKNGLTHNNINSVYVSGDQSLYLTTGDGIAWTTDGGATFVTKSSADGFTWGASGVRVDSLGNIFVATSSGLAVSSDGGATFNLRTTSDGLPVNSLTSISMDGSDNIYVTSTGGVSVTSDLGASFTTLNTDSNSLGHNFAREVHATASGDLWVATQVGVSYKGSSDPNFTNYTTSDGLNHALVIGITLSAAGDVLAFDNAKGINILKQGESTFTSFTPSDGFTDDYTRGFGVLADGTMLVGFQNSGYSVSTDNGSTWSNIKGNPNISSANIKWIEVLTGDILAIGTYSDGIFYTDDPIEGIFKQITTDDGLPNNSTNSAMIASDGTWYVATDSGIGVSSDNGESFTTITDGLLIAKSTSITEGADGSLCVAHYDGSGGLSVTSNGGTSFTTMEKPSTFDWPVKCTTNSSGKILMVGGNGVHTTSDNGSTWVEVDDYSDNSGIAEILNISLIDEDSFWLSNGNGVISKSDDYGATVEKITQESFSGVYFNLVAAHGDHVAAASDEGLFVSSDGGLNFTKYTSGIDGLKTQNIHAMAMNSKGGVYFAVAGGGLFYKAP